MEKLYRQYKVSTFMIRVRLREAMERHHVRTGERITFERLAQLTGLSRQTLESLSSRPGYNTTLGTIAKLCQTLDCQPGDLLILDPDQPNGPSY